MKAYVVQFRQRRKIVMWRRNNRSRTHGRLMTSGLWNRASTALWIACPSLCNVWSTQWPLPLRVIANCNVGGTTVPFNLTSVLLDPRAGVFFSGTKSSTKKALGSRTNQASKQCAIIIRKAGTKKNIATEISFRDPREAVDCEVEKGVEEECAIIHEETGRGWQ